MVRNISNSKKILCLLRSSFSESQKKDNKEEKEKTEKGQQNSGEQDHYFGTLDSSIKSFVLYNLKLVLVCASKLKSFFYNFKTHLQFIIYRHTSISPLVQEFKILL